MKVESTIDPTPFRVWARDALTRFQQEAKGVSGPQEGAALLNEHAQEIADWVIYEIERARTDGGIEAELEHRPDSGSSIVINRKSGPVFVRETKVGDILIRYEAPTLPGLRALIMADETDTPMLPLDEGAGGAP